MIIIHSKQDLSKIKNQHLKQYVNTFLDRLLFELKNSTDDIDSIGVIFILENSKDFNNYKAFGLSSPIRESRFEYIETLSFGYCNGCIVLNNSEAINIIGKYSYFKEFLGKVE